MLSKSEEEEGETSEKVGFAKPASIVNPTTAPSTSVFDMPNQLHTDSLDMEARGIPNLVSSPVFSSSPNKSKRTGQGASVTIKQEEISDVENDFEEIQTYKRKPLVKSSPPIEFARPYQQDQYNIDDEATLKTQIWDLDDFQVNSHYGGQSGLRHAFKESYRGKRRKDCIPGQCDCENCTEFHRLATTSVNGAAGNDNKPAPVTREAIWNKDSIAQQRVSGIQSGSTNKNNNTNTSFWGRPKSPPGFWRSDFPSTQETREEKRQAQERQRAEVAARLAEAARKQT
ncbi:hypothetical protein DV454_001821 [Geotrichum candidum]|nr:hypothetical protein DV454_001821 [Geotrichum candidum]